MYVAEVKAQISYRAADLRLCFRISKKRFSHDAAHVVFVCCLILGYVHGKLLRSCHVGQFS